MASVHLARDEALGRPVAIKLLADHLAGDPAFRERFVREARTAARLAHPNVVGVFDAGEDEGRPYIVMEYVEGETLAEVLRRRGRVPYEEAVGLALQACAGIGHAHAAGLVHRDVKPQNLLLRTDGTLKIADFGIARAVEASLLTEAGTVLGTAAYLAPEQAAGEPVTAAADVYSLAAVFYELLTGRTPFVFESLAELARKQAEEPIAAVRELVPDVPEPVESVVMRALARLPQYRPASAAELGQELAAAAGWPAEPSSASEAATLPLARSARSARRGAWLIGAVALAAVAVGLLLASSDDDAGDRATPPDVEPVAPGATPEQGARNVAEWLRERAGG